MPRYIPLYVDAVNAWSGEFPDDELLSAESRATYKSMVRSIPYASIVTRTDIAHVAGIIDRYSAKLTKAHLAATKHTLPYLKYTKSLRLSLPSGSIGTAEVDICIFPDADFAGYLADQKSTSDITIYTFRLLIYWKSKKQSVIAQGTADAEFVVSAIAMLEA